MEEEDRLKRLMIVRRLGSKEERVVESSVKIESHCDVIIIEWFVSGLANPSKLLSMP